MGLYTASLLVLLFFRPNDQTYHSWNLIPFSTIGFYLSGNVNWLISFYNLAANIGLFIPFGIFLMVNTSRSLMKLFLFPMMAIALIEVLQLITHRGSLDIDDLILNMLGIIVGYLFYPVFKRIVSIQR
jgi:glycopeptide antibiotics resistance protein